MVLHSDARFRILFCIICSGAAEVFRWVESMQ